MTYTDPARVVDIARDHRPPLSGQTVTGYGGRIPSTLRIRYRGQDGRERWHRVRVMVYGNGGAPYIVAGGTVLHLDTDTEQRAADIPAATRCPAHLMPGMRCAGNAHHIGRHHKREV